jgi:hypothetical protein
MALVNHTGKNVLSVGLASGELVRLMPGVNEIEDAKFELIKQHPNFQGRITSGIVVILEEKVGKDGKKPIEDMLKIIPSIFDTKLLKKIVDTDGREKVIHAARAQLDHIKHPSKQKADEENEHFS